MEDLCGKCLCNFVILRCSVSGAPLEVLRPVVSPTRDVWFVNVYLWRVVRTSCLKTTMSNLNQHDTQNNNVAYAIIEIHILLVSKKLANPPRPPVHSSINTAVVLELLPFNLSVILGLKHSIILHLQEHR